jgi:hypothetical protein
MNSKPIQSAVLAVAATFTLVAGAVSPAMARASDPAKPKPKQEKTVLNPDQKICVEAKVTGSRVAKRECHTRSEWIALVGQDPSKAQQN